MMNEAEKPKMIKCPECPVEFSEDDLPAQMSHMDKNHPALIAQRRRQAGVHERPRGPQVPYRRW